MPPSSNNHDAHDYAERIRERLPGTLRQARGLTMYALEKKLGVSREMIRCIEEGAAIPTFHVGAKLAHGVGLRLTVSKTRRGGDKETGRPGSPCLARSTQILLANGFRGGHGGMGAIFDFASHEPLSALQERPECS